MYGIDSGTVTLQGTPVQISGPAAAQAVNPASLINEHSLTVAQLVAIARAIVIAIAARVLIAAVRSIAAVFSGNDQMAFGILHALKEKGLSALHYLSRVGFDDIPEARYVSPPLTTVAGDFAELGRAIMSTLTEILPGTTESDHPHSLPVLLERASTARLA